MPRVMQGRWRRSAKPAHTCACVRIRAHTSAYVRMRQHTTAVCRGSGLSGGHRRSLRHTSADVSICQRTCHSGRCRHRFLRHTSAYVSIRQHTSAYVSIRQYTSACISIRQHASAYVNIPAIAAGTDIGPSGPSASLQTSVSCIHQHTSAYVSIRQHMSAYVSIRQHTSASKRASLAYVRIRHYTSAYGSLIRNKRLLDTTALIKP